MAPKSKAPPVQGEASHDQLGGWSQSHPSVDTLRVQILMLAYGVRPEWAAMLASLAFGGHCHD